MRRHREWPYAACPPAEIEAALAASLATFTDFTLRNREAFRQAIEETQANGYSVNRQGMEAGVISASAAIRAPGARPIGCITIAAPFVRTQGTTIHDLGHAAVEAATRISNAFFGMQRQDRAMP